MFSYFNKHWLCLFLFVITNRCRAVENEGSNKLVASKIEIKGLDSLVGELSYRGTSIGNNLHFGKTIKRKLYYTKRKLCNGQLPDTPHYIKREGYVLLIDRGECSFVEKIKNAQRDNATAVFIADGTCSCQSDKSCDSDEKCNEIETTMIDNDNGSEFSIDIPSMLILKADADKLRRELKVGTLIDISISFPVPKAVNGRTEYMIFTTPEDTLSRQFLDSFLEAALSLGERAFFQPRMLVKDGTEKGCRQYDELKIPCAGYCTNYGRYCQPRSSINDKGYFVGEGKKMVVESIRRACIWNKYGKDGIGREWWKYVQFWNLQCSFSQYSTSCSERIYNTSGIDKDDLETCMQNFGNFHNDIQNSLMEESLSDAAKFDVHFTPAFVVNGVVVQGALTFGNAMRAICSTFDEFQRPEICGKWNSCADHCERNGTSCILWGEDEECAEYRSPFLSNKDKRFDDDYIYFDVSNSGVPVDVTIVSTDGISNIDSTNNNSIYNSEANPSKYIVESIVGGDKKITAGMNPLTNNPVMNSSVPLNTTENSDRTSSHEGQQEILETIQIYEGSTMTLAIGIGIGFCSMFLCMGIYLLLSKDQERRIENMIASGRIQALNSNSRSEFSTSEKRCFVDYRKSPNKEAQLRILNGSSYFDDYDDEESYDSRIPGRKFGKMRRFRRKRSMSCEEDDEKNGEYRPYTTVRASDIRQKIVDDEFNNFDEQSKQTSWIG